MVTGASELNWIDKDLLSHHILYVAENQFLIHSSTVLVNAHHFCLITVIPCYILLVWINPVWRSGFKCSALKRITRDKNPTANTVRTSLGQSVLVWHHGFELEISGFGDACSVIGIIQNNTDNYRTVYSTAFSCLPSASN